MNFVIHSQQDKNIAELVADGIVIHTASDGLDLIGNVYYQGFDRVILHQKNIAPAFFDLKTGIAGEILQKFSNYRMRLAIVGDFASIESKSLRDLIFESNKGKQVGFVGTVEEALEKLGR